MKENFEFPFTPAVRYLLAASIWQMNKCQELAKKIADYYFTNDDEDYIIETFIKIALAIEMIREKYIGHNKEIDRVNFFVNLIGEHAGAKLSCTRRTERRLNNLASVHGIENADFLGAKIKNLHDHIFNTNNLLDYYEKMAKPLNRAIESFNKERELKPATAQVFAELLELRKYGVKTSAFQEGVLAEPGHFWILSPTGYAYRELDQKMANNWQVRKRIELMEKNCLAGINVTAERELTKGSDISYGGFLTGFSVNSFAAFSLKFDGELSGFTSTGEYDLKNTFALRGQSELYELLKANATFRLYDLIVPLIIHQKYELPPFPQSKKFLGLFPSAINFDPKLYLRRIRTIFDKRREITEGLDAEVKAAIINRPNMTKRDHDVICHIRTLPEGYRASEKARRLAKEILNYDLKEGETFVSQHYGKNENNPLPLAKSKH